MKLWILGSGSGGNAVVIESDDTRVLVDAGFGVRTLATRMKIAGLHPASISACVLTHDHTDHTRGAAAAARKWGWSLHATAGTAAARELEGSTVATFAGGEVLSLGALDVQAVATPHDAREPVGFVVTSRRTGARAGICYDVGHASDGVRALCTDVDILVLESNHDDGMLRAGPYPYWLQQRIAGPQGHLSNRAAGELAKAHASRQTAHVILAHLSERNNAPDVAARSMANALTRTAFRGQLSVASQDAVVGPFMPRGVRVAEPEQYALAF